MSNNLQTDAGQPAIPLLPASNGSAADRCPECGCKPPGHKIDCVSSNERARKAQRALAQIYANGRKRRRRQNDQAERPG